MQPTLFDLEAAPASTNPSPAGGVVNVASVPQLSPFRYPGGKTWLVPRLRRWLQSQASRPREFIEPFAGGGISSLTAAFEGRADWVTMVERDAQVASVWSTILHDAHGAEWLADRIRGFHLTPESAREVIGSASGIQLERPGPTRSAQERRELAFRTLLKNRINHGGILAAGSGTLKNGENGKGIASRWYPETLARRILAIAARRDVIQFLEGDGLQVLAECAARRDAVFFIDPPYTASGKRAGARLYTHSELDHPELFRLAATLQGDFLMTYDHAPGVLDMARQFGLDTQPVAMKNTHHAQMSELLIGRDLSWAR